MIDCHTHAVFGGNRSGEFEQRLEGVSYAEIAAAGGGIASTVRATREASEEELLASARKRLEPLLRDGVTALEIKSGYGLDLASERKMPGHPPPRRTPAGDRAQHLPGCPCATAGIRRARRRLHRAYLLDDAPALAGEGLVDAVDAFCEHLAFSPAQVERVFIAARELACR